jgi:hypothetical protein
MENLFYFEKIFLQREDGHCPSTYSGALINFLRKTNGKYIAFEPRTGTG